ncbi:hypothetical protein KQX54_016044 [Cotesia glomerata]|uniref:Uncharacterized protein n=1 Tax=Cotesia glomerata TaxID=32391 RepID=A0AAV7IA26_COTGL|nr:hypothetical protein KQX54_016044 [Cotesia glomerata]
MMVSSQLCKNIFFDRTEKLNGYTIRAAARIRNHFDPIFEKIDGFIITKASDIRQVTAVLDLREGLFSKTLAGSLNVSIIITHRMPVYISIKPFKYLMKSNMEIDLTSTTWTDNKKDVDTMNYIYLSYPFRFFYEQIVTHNCGLATPLEKMTEFYGWLTPVLLISAGFELCRNMFFDRTDKLYGYKIKAAAILKNHSKKKFRKLEKLITQANDTIQVISTITKRVRHLSKVLTNYLNVAIEITHGIIRTRSNHILYVVKLIEEGILELCLTPTVLLDTGGKYNVSKRIHLSYPLNFFYEQIVIHNRGLATPLEEMFKFYGWLIIIATFFHHFHRHLSIK